MSNKVLLKRDEISQYWHQAASLWVSQSNFSFETADRYYAFCAAKDWIQDTAETIAFHRLSGFSRDSHDAYLEFYGLLQAVFVQQDAIRELQYAVCGVAPNELQNPSGAWKTLRDLRNDIVGHPVRRGSGKEPFKRTVIGREPKEYQSVSFTEYSAGGVEHKSIALGELLDNYDEQAAGELDKIGKILKKRLQQ